MISLLQFSLVIILFFVGIVSLVAYFTQEKPIDKLTTLTFIYVSIVFGLFYFLYITNLLDTLFSVLITLATLFLLNFLTGLNITRSLLVKTDQTDLQSYEDEDEDEDEDESYEYDGVETEYEKV
jgi:ABC-type multidrug transport system fused ATPase/permease subunit